MPGRRTWMLVSFLLLAMPLIADERQVILVIADPVANRAYIPEGTVLRPGMHVRADARPVERGTIARLRAGRADQGEIEVRESQAMTRVAMARLKARPPLVFEYAPAERFVEVRKAYEAQVAKASSAGTRRPATSRSRVRSDSQMTCYDTYVQQTVGGFTNGFTSTICQSAEGVVVGQANPWEFRATGDYTETDYTISPAAYVDDVNGNFECLNYAYGYTSPLSCTASNSTVLLQQGCLNDVDTGALLYKIEYNQGETDPEPYYMAFTFLVDYCTYFY